MPSAILPCTTALLLWRIDIYGNQHPWYKYRESVLPFAAPDQAASKLALDAWRWLYMKQPGPASLNDDLGLVPLYMPRNLFLKINR